MRRSTLPSLVICFIALSSTVSWRCNIALSDVFLSLPPLSLVTRWWFVPPPLRSTPHPDGWALLARKFPLRLAAPVTPLSRVASLALAVPFTARQTQQLLASLRHLRSHAVHPPQTSLDVVLFFNGPPAALPHSDGAALTREAALLLGRPAELVCLNLSGADDAYGALDATGPNVVFAHMLQLLRLSGYEAAFIMEPDVWSVRPGWEAALVAAAADDDGWWVRGSVWQLWRPTDGHLNGNALYRLGNGSEFPLFVHQALSSAALQPGLAYDGAMMALMHRIAHSWNEFKTLGGRLQQTSIVVNLSMMRPCWSAEDVLALYPKAFFVHSKGRADRCP